MGRRMFGQSSARKFPLLLAAGLLAGVLLTPGRASALTLQLPGGAFMPTSHRQCDDLNGRWREIIRRVEQEHQACLDSKRRGEPHGPNCSVARCESLHVLLYGDKGQPGRKLSDQQNAQQAKCRADVSAHLRREAEEKRRREEAERRRLALLREQQEAQRRLEREQQALLERQRRLDEENRRKWKAAEEEKNREREKRLREGRSADRAKADYERVLRGFGEKDDTGEKVVEGAEKLKDLYDAYKEYGSIVLALRKLGFTYALELLFSSEEHPDYAKYVDTDPNIHQEITARLEQERRLFQEFQKRYEARFGPQTPREVMTRYLEDRMREKEPSIRAADPPSSHPPARRIFRSEEEALRWTLENSRGRTSTNWENADAMASGQIEIHGVQTSREGELCKIYSGVRANGIRREQFQGTACRNPRGEWRNMPGIELAPQKPESASSGRVVLP